MILLLVGTFIFLHGCIIWLWYRHTGNPSVVDVGWATGLMGSGLLYLNHSGWTPRALILGLALTIWGIRLAGYLWFTRIRHKHIDQRYLALSSNWKIAKPLGFFLNFQLQGIFIFVISLTWYTTALNAQTHLSYLDSAGLFIFSLAISLESAADAQLAKFKKQFPGRVCNVQLWRYSRHPNYFFEWLIWCSFTLFSLSSPYGWIAFISPLALYLIMTRITVPLTEQGSIQSKGEEYIFYQKSTPMFFPFKEPCNDRDD